MAMDVVHELANHLVGCRYENLPPQVIESTKASTLDILGVMIAATTAGEGCREIFELATGFGGVPESSIVGFGGKAPCYLAAFINGALCHALDYDDSHDPALCHPAAEVLPAALAIADRMGGVNGREFITALTVGIDLVCRMGLAIKSSRSEHGWVVGSLVGYFGGAATAGKLLGLNAKQIVDALGLSYCQAAGSAQMGAEMGSVFRGLRDGFAQKAGVLSALLAEKGLTGPKNSLEGTAGLYNLYFKGKYDRSELTNALGTRYEGLNVSYKPYPSCRLTHSFIDATLGLLEEFKIDTASVVEVTAYVNADTKTLCEPRSERLRPLKTIDAKYSLPFCIGKTLANRSIHISDFMGDGLLQDTFALELAEKVRYEVDPDLTVGVCPGTVMIRTKGGAVYQKTVDYAYGDPRNPISLEGIEKKFRDCLRHSVRPFSQEQTEKIVESVRHLEHIADIRHFSHILTPNITSEK